jgi:DNA-binding CsgD family transcriptional regulator
LLAWAARTRYLRGRHRHALEEGEVALATAVAAGDRRSESEVLNTLGMAEIVLGRVDEGAARLRRAIEIAREDDDIDGAGTAYSNLADTLSLAGRTEQALETAKEGQVAVSGRVTRPQDWMALTVSDLAFEAGDWGTARTNLDAASPAKQLVGRQLIFRHIRQAEFALGVGDEDTAVRCLEEVEPLVARSFEPQWIGAYGALLAELRRRQRDLAGARAAVTDALDRIELCTDDVMRIARVTAAGMRVEADIAERARDLRDRADERDSVARARVHMQRLRAAAEEGGPVEIAWKAVGNAELARARGKNDPTLWVKAGREWEAMSRPYVQAYCLWRATEGYVEVGDREAACASARDALAGARRLGARWLEDELVTLAQRARLDVGEDAGERTRPESNGAGEDPFGLTARERQVLALVAEGATNRQIGAALFMAEKTASVHVSRILSKLGVRSRTQAAAVAHRLHLE